MKVLPFECQHPQSLKRMKCQRLLLLLCDLKTR